MRTWWKVLIGVVVAGPMVAYVAGTLAATGDEPAPRQPIVLEESVAPSASSSPSGTPTRTPEPSSTPSPSRSADDHGGDGPETNTPETITPQTITPSPDDLDDHGDDEGRGGDDNDNRGHGNGSDDGADHD